MRRERVISGRSVSKIGISLVSTLVLLGLSACENNNAPGDVGRALGSDQVNDPPHPIPSAAPAPVDTGTGTPSASPTPAPSATPAPTAGLGQSCHTSDPDHICLSLKYVVYQNGAQAKPVASDQDALTNLTTINEVWAQCNIGFEIGEYIATDPATRGLSYNTPTMAELGTIRKDFASSTELVVVTTGAWSGTLGAGSANAWTAMPGGGPFGVVMEESVATYPNIIAHELGHYLNLDHVSDQTDVMNPVIYQGSTKLTTAQCASARAAAQGFWKAMYR